uniref:NADH-ubiquinone oxidoreductase chain 2 n=2 Tax=Hiatula TaxID=2341033 RepID=A0A4P8KY77_9BIVA|nr:NADH dehydrogenase subunit 2 [Hiatula diphos]YP_009642896.1 NADH dehydrogenase subunit 2 [Hiatula acuta]AEV94290.1 NADH dehydrogenase subunit 2 [Hiatula diphos]QCQ20460.1 NADH dehydrogenase subunit 2 [Hiatula acuta]
MEKCVVWGMVLNPSFIVFFVMSLLGTILVLLSSGLLGMWICLELGFFGFIPLLNGKTVGENESAVKYFVVQSIGSGLLLFSFLIISGDYLMLEVSSTQRVLSEIVMVLGFMVKLGVFPMHFWFPSVMSSASWLSCFWLSITQKLGPFWALGGLGLSGMVLSGLMSAMVFTSVVGAFGGLAQVQFRPLLAYSSLGQTGWIGLVVMLSSELFLYYIVLYSLLLVGLLLGLNSLNSYSVSSVAGWGLGKGLLFWLFSCSFFISLSGLPPLAGFAMKLLGVLLLAAQYPLYLFILIGTSMVSLYYYLSMFISSVVYVGGSKFVVSDGVVVGSVGGFLIVFGIMNWLGGLPMFMLSAVLVL